MTRASPLLPVLLLLLGAGVGPSWAQETPEGEKKPAKVDDRDGPEDQPERREGREREKKTDAARPPDPFGDPDSRADEVRRLVDEISGNMKRIESLLNRRETGASTQKTQRETLEQIQKLIDMFPP